MLWNKALNSVSVLFFFFFFFNYLQFSRDILCLGKNEDCERGKAERRKCHYSVSDFQNSHLKPVSKTILLKVKASENWNVKEVKKKKKNSWKGIYERKALKKQSIKYIHKITDQKKQKWKAKGPHPSGKIKTALSRWLEKGRALEGQPGGPERGWWKRVSPASPTDHLPEPCDSQGNTHRPLLIIPVCAHLAWVSSPYNINVPSLGPRVRASH